MVNGNIDILENATVSIEAGTTLLFSNVGNYSLTVLGELRVLGTADAPVVFTADSIEHNAADGAAWAGIEVVHVEHALIRFKPPSAWTRVPPLRSRM